MTMKEALILVRTQKEGSYDDLKKQIGLSSARRLLCFKVIELKESGDGYRWRLIEEEEPKVGKVILNFLRGVFEKIKRIGRV